MAIATINPTTGQLLQTFAPMDESEVEQVLAQAALAFGEYRNIPLAQRAAWLNRAANLLEQERDRLASLITLEMGKTYRSAQQEIEKCALVCRYYAEYGPVRLQDTPVTTGGQISLIRYQPVGPVLAVMPWNFPFWQVFRFAAPNLILGNVGLLKHASNVPQCALAIQEIIDKAGFPKGTWQTLLIEGTRVPGLLGDRRIQGATLTGSAAAGAALAQAAGANLKKTVLELGGSDPFIVMPSADLQAAAAAAVTARMLSNGQSCIAAKRFIVAEAIAPEFIDLLVAKFQGLQVGDPMAETTQLGPLATPEIRQELDSLVQRCVAMGAKILTGGKPLDRPGNFYPATILTDLPPGSPADTEEFFGPVALVFPVPDLTAAIQLANASPFGLGASIWTQDAQERDQAIDQLEAGSVFVNAIVKSDPRLPFGGIKTSGYGRELGDYGLLEFANIKTICLA